jgi:hypothetical protein
MAESEIAVSIHAMHDAASSIARVRTMDADTKYQGLKTSSYSSLRAAYLGISFGQCMRA